MKRLLHLTIALFLFAPVLASSAFAGEVIDGIVATVNRQPVFLSDWQEAIAFEALMQQKSVAQMTQADRAKALQRLIDRQLLGAQMGDETFLQPSDDDLDKDIAKLRAQLPEGADDQNWQKFLAGYGLTQDSVKAHLRAEVRVMNFVEVRLRPNVHIQPEEIEGYYQNQLLPDLQAAGSTAVTLNEVEPRIRELLVQRHMDELLDQWLHNLRQQAEIKSSVPIPAVNAPADENGAPGSN
jgi:parvulin-like peptidyl-prolyl isomerase